MLSMADRLETMYTVSASPPLDSAVPPPKKRKVNFSLTLDIKQETEVRKQRKYFEENIFSILNLKKIFSISNLRKYFHKKYFQTMKNI